MKKKHSELLKKIYSEVPKEWIASLMKKGKVLETNKKLLQIAIEEEGYPEEKKEMYRNLLSSGAMDIEEEIMDAEVAKQIDDFIDSKVLIEVEAGNLPKVAKTEIMKKWRKYERANNNK